MLGLAAAYSAIRFLSDAVASLPIRVYRRLPDGSTQRVLSSMLLGDEVSGGGPQIAGTMYEWLFEGTASALIHGNAWGLITNRSGIPGADGLGLPTGVAWLPAERVSVQDDEQQPENPLRARIYYNGRLADRANLVQLKAFGVPGRVEGISPLRNHAMLWFQGREALKYSSDWFQNGGFPPGTFQNVSDEVNESQSNEIRRRLTDAIRLRQPLVYGSDWDYKPITVPQDEATFITAMQLNACTTPEARILMADGTRKQVADLRLGDEVAAWDGERLVRDRVAALAEMPEAPLTRVTVQGGRELTTTGNHPYLARRGRRLGEARDEWVRADGLRPGDWVRLGLDWETSGDGLDEETAWALGALAGNGALAVRRPPAGTSGGYGCVTFSTPDRAVARRLAAWCDRMGGGMTQIPWARGREVKCDNYRIRGLNDLLRQFGMLGKHAWDKTVPAEVVRGGRKAHAAFLSGYLDTDGCVTFNPAPCVSWTSVSFDLLDECRSMLDQLGVGASLSGRRVSHAGDGCRRRDFWTLNVQGAGRVGDLARWLGPSHEEKRRRLARVAELPVVKKNWQWARVTEAGEAGRGVTIGVTIGRTHTHVTEGIVTHNTQVAAIYGVRAQRVGGTRNDGMAYSNQTEDQLDELQNTLRPWLKRWEDLLTGMLPSTQFAKFHTDSFLKMDPKTRTGVQQIQRSIGTRTVNEIRAEDDLLPLSTGDDSLPLQIEERMMATTRSIPKAFMPDIILEADRIADLLVALQKKGLTAPIAEDTQPIGKTGAGYLGGLLTQVRSNPAALDAIEALMRGGATEPVIRQYLEGVIEDQKAMGHSDALAITAGSPAGAFGNPGMRASDTDRERAKGMIRHHLKAGRLRPAEAEERIRKAAEAVRCGDLDTLFADLPVAEQAAPAAEEDRSGGPKGPMFGPAAIALLQQRAMQFDSAAPAALNGKAH